MWVTDGTAGGTHEVAGTSGLDPTGMTVYNGVVLFSGLDGSGHAQLWKTNGATVQEISTGLGSPAGLIPFDLTSVSISTPPPTTTTPPNFFNSDNKADILWQNANGDTALWNSSASGGFTPEDLGIVGGGWQIAGTGDFKRGR